MGEDVGYHALTAYTTDALTRESPLSWILERERGGGVRERGREGGGGGGGGGWGGEREGESEGRESTRMNAITDALV